MAVDTKHAVCIDVVVMTAKYHVVQICRVAVRRERLRRRVPRRSLPADGCVSEE
jgi:hypothetical protein